MTRTQRQIEEHRQGEACIEVRDPAGRPWAGIPVWVEQETHAFVFGCVAPALPALPTPDRQRYEARLNELFNRVIPARPLPDPGASRIDVPDAVHLGRFRHELDRLSRAGLPLDVYVRGRCVGLGAEEADTCERSAAERVAELYTLCFAHPAVRGVFWEGFWDGEEGAAGGGLLRLDLAPRPAFRYLEKLIGTVWHTRAGGETDRDGRFRFRGFFGDYRVAARLREAATTGLFPFHGVAGAPYLLQVAAWPAPVPRPVP